VAVECAVGLRALLAGRFRALLFEAQGEQTLGDLEGAAASTASSSAPAAGPHDGLLLLLLLVECCRVMSWKDQYKGLLLWLCAGAGAASNLLLQAAILCRLCKLRSSWHSACAATKT
jgi:hypothetical protein